MLLTSGLSVSGEQVTVRVDGEVRDSGSFEGGGMITYMVIADTDWPIRSDREWQRRGPAGVV